MHASAEALAFSFTLPHPFHLLPMQHDDAITSRTYDAMRSVTDGVEASGCPATATMFVTSDGTGGCGWAAVAADGWVLVAATGAPHLLRHPETARHLAQCLQDAIV